MVQKGLAHRRPALWEEHTSYEFEDHSTEKTLSTMTDDPININVPLLTGGVGLEEVRKYYPLHYTTLQRTEGPLLCHTG